MIRPFVQGTSASGRRNARQYVLILAAAHVVAAGLIVFLLSQVVGVAVQEHVAPTARVAIIGAAAVIGVVLDVRAVRRRSFSVGVERQTPKALAHTSREWWVTPLLWGADTGLIWTTYRVSFCSWMLLVLVALGEAPPWTGLVYGLSFTVPLLAVVSRRAARDGACDLPGPRRAGPRTAQWAGVASMVLLSAGLLWLQRGLA